ncbi:MAG TPA: tyrosine-type recombinase/integrase [Trebonia sp.]|nr:tyrosine-type recombinase/integrase [Trebonia sp.]
MVLRRQGVHRPKPLEAGPFAADVASFRLHLAAENKAPATVRTYTEAVLWFAAAYLLAETGKCRWEQVSGQDVQRWTVWLLARYSDSYASSQFRALQQFFKWLAAEEGIPSPMARLRLPGLAARRVPSFTSDELSRLGKACRGSAFADRRDAAIIAVLLATGIRASELAGIRYLPGDPCRSDVDLAAREVRVLGKGGRPRTVKLTHEAARRLDRYLRARSRHPLAWRPELWLGTGSRGPLDRSGIYQLVVRRGKECGVLLYPHRFRHHFCQAWQMGRVASDASFPGKRDLEAVGACGPGLGDASGVAWMLHADATRVPRGWLQQMPGCCSEF